jgi:hypothetical protein
MARFVSRSSTVFEVQSTPLFQVSLIRGLRFTPLGYISRGRPPPSGHLLLISYLQSKKLGFRPSIQVEEVEVPLDNRLVLVLLVHILVLVLLHLVVN